MRQNLFVGQNILKDRILTHIPVQPGDAPCHLRLHGSHLILEMKLFTFIIYVPT